jgi:PAS domain S-box-containing protein
MPTLRSLFLSPSPTLARRIQWQIGAVIAVVIGAITWLSYRNTVDTLRLEAVDNLKASVQARGIYESVTFLNAQTNTQALRDDYLRRLSAMGTQDPVAEFNAWFVRYPDGVVRVRPERDDYKQKPSIYIRPPVVLNAELRRQVVVAFQLLQAWGPVLTQRYFSAYIDLPGQSLIMYSPAVNWGQEADATTNNFDYPPVQNSAPDKNPTRKSLWTDVYFDDKALTWMVSIITPVDQQRWVGTASQDITIDALIERTNEQAAPGTFNLILDAQGRLLAHPALMVPIRKSGGNLDVGTLADPLLVDIATQAKQSSGAATVVPSADGNYYLGISRIQGPEWYWVTVYPKSLVDARGLDAARSILLLGVVGLFVELTLLAWIIRRTVSAPLKKLSDAAQALADGNMHVQLNVEGQAELAQLARNFANMTEKLREREAVLVRSEAFKDALFQTIPDVVFVKDPHGRFLAANRAFETTFGFTIAAILGKTDSDFLDAKSAAYFAAQDREALAAGVTTFSENGHLHAATGARISFETIKAPIFGTDGALLGLLGIGRDVTERRRAQDQLVSLNRELEDRVLERTRDLGAANAELTEAMAELQRAQNELVQGEKLASLGRMVAGVAHELNTPIGNALTIGSTMADHAKRMHNAMSEDRLKRSELVAYLRDSADGAQVLERALRQASRLIASFKQVAADQQSEQRRTFDLATNVDEILAILRPGLRGTDITLESAVPPGIAMDSYPGLLAQVLSNLVTNAKVHAFEGVVQGAIHVEVQDLGEMVSVAIRDNGNGIPEAIRSRIFDPFFTTRMGRGGTGLGLSIVHGIVTQGLCGGIRVDYSATHGTCFVVTVPKVVPGPSAEPVS